MENGISTNDFLRKIALPKRYFDTNFNLIDKFKDEMDMFFDSLKICTATEFNADQQINIQKTLNEIEDEILQTSQLIESILISYENADMMQAQLSFDKLMEDLKDDIFVSDIFDNVRIKSEDKCYIGSLRINKGYQFYRVRAVDNESNHISKNANELFHLPLSKREFANGGRFSLTGFPSLYLSSMLPLAWQETGYPQQYYYSEYSYKYDYEQNQKQPINDLKFISLYSPQEIAFWAAAVRFNDFEFWKKIFVRYLKMYPLILACSFVNQRGNSPYKQEYIFPQMLMQWVQRNSNLIQGVAYFTCLDMSLITEGWCAYNLALPATKPNDQNGYSKVLFDSFNWTLPKFYSIPIADLTQNKSDRKIISDFVDTTLKMLSEQHIPQRYSKALLKMNSISTQLLTLLNKSNNVDMELVLNMLKSIQDNHYYFIEEKLEDCIEKARDDIKSKIDYCEDDVFLELTSRFKDLYKKFVSKHDYSNDIGGIIEKYISSTWNFIYQKSYFQIFGTNIKELKDIAKQMQNNNAMFFLQLLNDDEKSFNEIKQISQQTKQPLDIFWETPIGDDAWIRENILNIKQPFIVKCNSTSVLSPKELKKQEFVCFGFDVDKINAHM